jgi:hypothetical protein
MAELNLDAQYMLDSAILEAHGDRKINKCCCCCWVCDVNVIVDVKRCGDLDSLACITLAIRVTLMHRYRFIHVVFCVCETKSF